MSSLEKTVSIDIVVAMAETEEDCEGVGDFVGDNEVSWTVNKLEFSVDPSPHNNCRYSMMVPFS